MKKVFFALACVAMFSFAACNGNNAEAADTTAAVEEVAPEATCEENAEAVEGAVEEGTEEAQNVVAE